MISFIIPIINPLHSQVKNYQEILTCLARTLDNLLNSHVKVTIIVVAHQIPNWLRQKYHRVHFIIVRSKIFQILKDLDGYDLMVGGQITLSKMTSNIPLKYQTYLEMRGKYHNKDKGLKYFIGLLYYFQLPTRQRTKYLGLIDGDDFISKNLASILNQLPEWANLFYVNQGYNMYSDSIGRASESQVINQLFPLDNFSNVCGSNRFFRSQNLESLIKNRLRYQFPISLLEKLRVSRQVQETIIDQIMFNINQRPQSWNILPGFLGIHRLIFQEEGKLTYLHPFLKRFQLYPIPGRVAIKYNHTNNHSNYENTNHNELINRYQERGQITTMSHNIQNYHHILEQIGVTNYTIKNKRDGVVTQNLIQN